MYYIHVDIFIHYIVCVFVLRYVYLLIVICVSTSSVYKYIYECI